MFQAAVNFEIPTHVETCPFASVAAELLESDEEEDLTATSVISAEFTEDENLNFKASDDLNEIKKTFLQIQKTLYAYEAQANTPNSHTKTFLRLAKHWQTILSTDVHITPTPSLNPLPNTPRVQPNSNFIKQPTFKSIKKKRGKKNLKTKGRKMTKSPMQV